MSEHTPAYERGWREGVAAYLEGVARGTRVRPTHKGLPPRDPLAQGNPVAEAIDAQSFSGFLKGWLKAQEAVEETLKALEATGP